MSLLPNLSPQSLRASLVNSEVTGLPIQAGQSTAERIVDTLLNSEGPIDLLLELLWIIGGLLPVWLQISGIGAVALLITIWLYAIVGDYLAAIYRLIRDAVIAGKHIADDKLTAAWYRMRGNDPF